MTTSRTQPIVLLCGATMVLVLDLTTKVIAVRRPTLLGPELIYNPDIPPVAERIAVCAATILVLLALTKAAGRLGIGAIPIVWLAAGLLIGGVVANGVSGEIWAQGVPDWLSHHGRVWNLADHSIGLGLLLFLAASLGYAIRGFVRSRRAA